MRLPTKDLRLTANPGLSNPQERLILNLNDILSRTNQQINQLTEGQISAIHNARTSAPTTGLHQQGDFFRNAQPSVAGTAGSQYVITGWMCVVGGEPGTFVECRSLTGT